MVDHNRDYLFVFSSFSHNFSKTLSNEKILCIQRCYFKIFLKLFFFWSGSVYPSESDGKFKLSRKIVKNRQICQSCNHVPNKKLFCINKAII